MHHPSFLPADDLPPAETTQLDRDLHRQLELSTSKHFYECCNGVLQALLLSCEWYIAINANALLLVIACPDQATTWRVLNHIVAIGGHLAQLSPHGRIRVCPPAGLGLPYDLRVDELSIYRDSP
jgi:hypothetical protein